MRILAFACATLTLAAIAVPAAARPTTQPSNGSGQQQQQPAKQAPAAKACPSDNWFVQTLFCGGSSGARPSFLP